MDIEKENDIKYTIITKDKLPNKKLIAHLHCYDISKFDEIYGPYISNIEKEFSIIITYSIGKISRSNKYTIIKIPNKGMDIGGKFCAVDYIKKNKLQYTHILFLQSKTDIIARTKYFSFIDNNNFKTSLEKNKIKFF